ncbi:hypothetical protein CKM354_000787000 [Cercospora kikuchii]|uniref:NAD(P)-binding protein n=1 Tax=Cercospora kikuchii TaxID=84275 RepID=A0A9P3CHU9_9PEZI|nr:uncharacterized protein CKM354_000787000 [Cercospora kikuchii]GIZ44679.1 hypothetical protein CKM354_000787000 [Cercospora kikuchii]
MPSYLITGASRGLGYAWIKHLSADPSNTVFALVRIKPSTEEKLAQDGLQGVHVLEADVTDLPALQAAAQEVSKITNGSLDILIHNAALVGGPSAFTTVIGQSPEDLASELTDSFHSNVVGTSYVLNAFLPLIRAGKEKKIAVITSGMADLELVNKHSIALATPYAVSKAASNLLVGKYHAALGKEEGILVFSISPGVVNTQTGELTEEQKKVIGGMMAQFAEVAPHWKGPITAEESVTKQLEVIQRATVEEFGGAFVSHYGNQQWL